MNAVHFVGTHLAKIWPDLARLGADDVDHHATRFRGGPHNWIVQTYLHLRKPLESVGLTVSISEEFRPDSINIAHRDSLNRFWMPYARYYIVGVRADRSPIKVSDWELLQNKAQSISARQRYLPLWPQPGLLAREATRGHQITCIGYFGRPGASSTWLDDPHFRRRLADLGVRFEARDDCWFDYRDVDLVLAHRQESQTMLAQKPASKLINAWLAGVPALLGHEPGYAALRESELDYLTIAGPEAALAAVQRLQHDPTLYAAMIQNGYLRAVSYTVDASRERWLRFLLDEVVPASAHAQQVEMGTITRWVKKTFCLGAQKRASNTFRRRHIMELNQLEAAAKCEAKSG